jgi:hypothetical protein
MTAVDDRLKLGEERRLIFQNIANGVPMESIKTAFLRSEEQIWKDVEYVGRKIREYRFRRHLPPLEHQGISAIRLNRKALLDTLTKLGANYLAGDFILPNIIVQDLVSPGDIREAGARSGFRTTGDA